MNIKKLDRQLGEFLLGRIEVVWSAYLTIEDLVTSGINHWDEKASSGECTPAYAEHEMSRLATHCATLHRHGTLCAMSACLEDSLAAVSSSIGLSQSSGAKGSWLDKQIDRLSRDAGISTERLARHVVAFNHFLRLRNCITHCLGNVHGARWIDDTRESIKFLHEKDQETVIETNTGEIYLGDQAIPEAKLAADGILKNIINQLV